MTHTTVRPRIPALWFTFLGSSMVERPAVNRLVVGSSPARGATYRCLRCGALPVAHKRLGGRFAVGRSASPRSRESAGSLASQRLGSRPTRPHPQSPSMVPSPFASLECVKRQSVAPIGESRPTGTALARSSVCQPSTPNGLVAIPWQTGEPSARMAASERVARVESIHFMRVASVLVYR